MTSRSPERRDDLVQSFDALALAGKPSKNTTRTHAVQGFIGGFIPQAHVNAHSEAYARNYPDPPPHYPGSRPLSFPVPGPSRNRWQDGNNAQAPLPRPPAMPEPYHNHQQSLTMKHALAPPVPQDARPALGLATPALPPRAHSASAAPAASPAPSNPPKLRPPLASDDIKPNRPRAASSPPSPSSSSAASGACVQCAGQTKAGKQCTRLVKTGTPLDAIDPDVERFCFQHTKEVLGQSGFYARKNGEWIKFADWVPDYLQDETRIALRSEMEKSRSQSDVPGYIYTFEIRDPSTPARVQLKVGRAVNLVKRIDQWGKQCGSKEQILRGWWPGTVEADDGSLVKGRVKAGDKGLWCHRLERLVHLELADLSENAVYFDPGFPNTAAKVVAKGKGAASGSPKKAGPKAQDKACADCGAYHKEIFTFKRATRGRYAGKEWELLVKPIIEKWGAFVEAYV